MYVHEVIAAELAALGTSTMFGLLGDANLFMANSFVEDHNGTFISAAHESSAVMMAFGYACRSQGLGVATVTQGPGLTNTATALIEAVRSGTPVLLITGDTAPSNTINQQSLEQEPFVRATGAGYVLVSGPDDAGPALRRAARSAVVQSRPYVLNIPTEYQWAEVERVSVAGPAVADEPARSLPSEDVLGEAVAVIASASRPLVLAGRGVTSKEQASAVLEFAERVGAPICTTLRARNLFSVEEGCLGVFGTVSTEVGVKAIAEADCIVTFGSSLNVWTTVRNSLFEGKKVVCVDVDESRFRPDVPVTVSLAGDAAAVAAALVEYLDLADIRRSGFRDRAVTGVQADDLVWRAPLGQKLTLAGVFSSVGDALPAGRTVVHDGGRFQGESFKYMVGADFRSEVQTTTFGAVGMGMGAAIGAAAAAPGEPTVLVIGDGGFMMNGMAEMHSAIRAGLPIIVVICNDGSYGAEYDQFLNRGVRPDLSLFEWPDFAEVARSLGARAEIVESVADVEAATRALVGSSVPVVIDVRIPPQDVPEVPH